MNKKMEDIVCLVCDIIKLIAKMPDFELLKQNVMVLVLKYYPNVDEITRQLICELSISAQNTYGLISDLFEC